jgi:hypothetical membrane protein
MPSVFKRAAVTAVIATALALGAMARYPGGTPRDHTTTGYSFTGNFLSDLGMTVTYGGASNKLGAALFVTSLLLLVVGLGSSLATIVHLLARERASRRWASLAALFGLGACVAFAGVAVTPENHVMAIHVAFTFWAWRVVTIVAVLMAVASFRSTRFRRRATIAWSVVAALLGVYTGLLDWGPDVGTPDGLTTHVIAQKLATCVVVLGLLYVAREGDRAASR